LDISLRTAQRIVAGSISPSSSGSGLMGVDKDGRAQMRTARRAEAGGPILPMRGEDLEEIQEVLRRVARSSYLDIAGLDLQARPGEVILKAQVYEPEEEYE
jgi:hypothetical protein